MKIGLSLGLSALVAISTASASGRNPLAGEFGGIQLRFLVAVAIALAGSVTAC